MKTNLFLNRKDREDRKDKKWRFLFCAVLLCVAACRRDMHDQPKYEPLERSNFFDDQRSSRPLIEGTVARESPVEMNELNTGKSKDGKPVENFPVAVDEKLLHRGKERFNIFCTPCHDQVGTGQGMVVQRGYRRPPSLHITRLQKAPTGYFFDVITNGFGAMPDYSAQISVEDRWAIIAYIRALQLSQNAPAQALPENERLRLEQAK